MTDRRIHKMGTEEGCAHASYTAEPFQLAHCAGIRLAKAAAGIALALPEGFEKDDPARGPSIQRAPLLPTTTMPPAIKSQILAAGY
jgi:hypothetical protein